MVSTKIRADCKQQKPVDDFYQPIGHIFGCPVVKKLLQQLCIRRWKYRKLNAIEQKSAACERCGLHLKGSHFAVFEFYRPIPDQKVVDRDKLRLKFWEKLPENSTSASSFVQTATA